MTTGSLCMFFHYISLIYSALIIYLATLKSLIVSCVFCRWKGVQLLSFDSETFPAAARMKVRIHSRLFEPLERQADGRPIASGVFVHRRGDFR